MKISFEPFDFSHSIRWLVAGPCAAESEEGLRAVARVLCKVRDANPRFRVQAFRAGVWKPRSQPGTFEGMGAEALPWLTRLQQHFALPVCVEVATPHHVQQAYAAGIRQFWIGARTSGDPFAVELLAQSLGKLQGVECVYVKNPPAPDLRLWQGTIDRFKRQGIQRLVAVLRGFYQVESQYRNAPRWDVALDFMLRNPTIPLLCDASHIAGRVDNVPKIAMQSLEYGLQGLFVEVHHNPSTAKSDAKQQLSPEQFLQLLDDCAVQEALFAPPPEEESMELRHLRRQIDTIDEQLLDLLARRKQVVLKIGEWKQRAGVSPLCVVRWRHHLGALVRYGREHGLSSRFVGSLGDRVHREALRYQLEQRDEAPPSEAPTPTE